MRIQAVSALLLSLLVSACAGNKPANAVGDERFTPSTATTGQRLFTYSVTIEMRHGNRTDGNRQGGNWGEPSPQQREGMRNRDVMGPDPETLADMVRPQVYDLLHARLDETGYCPGGYRVLESTFGPASEIKGECIEQAE